ncbi:flavodoxin [Anaerocolumna cellulosilytica]|uniref:Flavodoxin n=1 Tax=Anaerocolumna cellulosilytica TaxID=433286 RepID=A0A6S6R030_9FIRM|nr:flavodoxin family protein [Anaerocolumna cellulosilytica]MBB5196898.1 flavodoxin [Anaerocolumna cellulosilytica]BCJ92700.1 flavodoxin [Anaerocolumna cellulosilytica]
MKVLVTYSSLTGNTQKVAEGIYEGIQAEVKDIKPMKEVTELDSYDVVLAGYWVDKGGPNEEAKKFLERLEGKKVGIFATLGYWPDTEHGWNSLMNGEEVVKEKNQVIAKYICQGKLNDSIIARFEKLPADNPHAITEEKRRRYAVAKNHPSEADIAHAAELFCERLSTNV